MPRGRPRIHPIPDPSIPKRPRGRPRLVGAGLASAHPVAPADSHKPVQTPGRVSPPSPPAITINNQPITWAFIRRVYNALGNDWDNVADAFWKARNATGHNAIYRYISAGMRVPSPGSIPSGSKRSTTPWISLPSRDREQGRMDLIREWWIHLYTPSARRTAAIAEQSSEVQSMIDAIAAKFGGVL